MMPDVVEVDGLVLPRWYTRRDNRLKSEGGKLAELCELIGEPQLSWQAFVTDIGLEVDSDGNYTHPIVQTITGRQSGKTRMLVHLILYALFIGDQKLILYAAQDRQQAKHVFEAVAQIVDDTPALKAEVAKRRDMTGVEMLRLYDGSTLRILSTRQSAWRGHACDLVILDELREHYDRDTFSAALYTMRARPNTQLWAVSTAGSPESVVLRDLVDRGRVSVDTVDPMAYFEWSADGIANLDPSDPDMWRLANPTLGDVIDEETLLEELRSDPTGFLCEALCVWVDDPAANVPLVTSAAWDACIDTEVDATRLSRVWLGIDLSLGMEVGHLVVAGWLDEQLVVAALETWRDPQEAAVAQRVDHWFTELRAEGVAFDPRTASGVGDRLQSQFGYQNSLIHKLVGNNWPRATSRLVEFVDRGTLVHAGDGELTTALLNTVRVTRPDGSWRIRRREVTEPITATVALLAAVDAGATPGTDWFLV